MKKIIIAVFTGTIEGSKVKRSLINNRKYVASNQKNTSYLYVKEKGRVKRIEVDTRYAELRIKLKYIMRKGKKLTCKVEILDDEIKLLAIKKKLDLKIYYNIKNIQIY